MLSFVVINCGIGLLSIELVDGVGSSAVGATATAAAADVIVAVGTDGINDIGLCDCDIVAFGDFLNNGKLLGMRFVDGGLALLAGICGGLSAPAG